MIKKLLFISTFIFLIIMTGCSEKVEEHKFDESKLKSVSEDLILEVNSSNGQVILDLMEVNVRKTVTIEQFNEMIDNQLSKAKMFDSIISTTFSQSLHPLEKYPIALVVVLAKFENGTMTYNFNFNELNEIIGFNMVFQTK